MTVRLKVNMTNGWNFHNTTPDAVMLTLDMGICSKFLFCLEIYVYEYSP